MRFMLLKNKGDTYFQTDAYNLSDYVNSLSKFLSISPKEFMGKIEFPEGMKHVTSTTYDLFDINIADSRAADAILENFSKHFKALVHENNHRMPIHYKIMDVLIDGYSDRTINNLSSLRFWRIGN